MKNSTTLNTAFFLFLAILFSSFTSQAQDISFADPHFKAALVANFEINTNEDHEIQKTEALAVTGLLDVSNAAIYNLDGIEYFSNITSLNCSKNILTDLSLPTNTRLVQLDCSNNLLTTLDINNNHNLLLLDFHNNSIKNIDLSNNTALISLIAQNNDLETLRLNNNVDLLKVNCSNNNLTSLDLSDNSNINSLNCASNNLTSLNLANHNNTNLSSVNATNNSLNCVKVDDKTYSDVNWSNSIDPVSFFSNTCNSIPATTVTTTSLTVFPNSTNE